MDFETENISSSTKLNNNLNSSLFTSFNIISEKTINLSNNILDKEIFNQRIDWKENKVNLFDNKELIYETKDISTNLFEKNIDKINNLENKNDYLNKKKKTLIEISKNLTKIEYLEIFNIIQK